MKTSQPLRQRNVASGHSPLGASGASRFIACPGSVLLSAGIEDEESDHATLGTAAHKLGELCLNASQGHPDNNHEPWSWIGTQLEGGSHIVDKDMADAVQEYLDAVREWHPDRNQGNSWVEKRFHCPTLHKFFWGTSDFVYHDAAERTLHVWDYKHGAGIVVEVENNVQCMYYACGVLEELQLWETVDQVVLHIAQPRGFHFDGPIRSWGLTTDELEAWLFETLLPAMDTALVSREAKTGEHCRFCPARSHACPAMEKDLTELEGLMKEFDEAEGAAPWPAEKIGRFLDLYEVAKIAQKAMLSTGTARANAGHPIPGWKLVPARANRVWKDEAEVVLKKKLGKKAYTEPKLKTPAQIEGLPGGKDLSTRYAYKPEAGLTLAPEKDGRPKIDKSVKSMFTDQTKKKETV